jgi:fibronectin-binding autotransporter adhesin
MNDHRRYRMKRLQKCSLCLAVISLIGSQAHLAAADTTASWVPDANGVWASTTKWTSNPNYPHNGKPVGTNYVAVINVTGTKTYAVTLNTTPITIDGLTIDSSQATLDQTGGSFTPGPVNIQAGTYLLDGSTSVINNAAISVSSGEMGLLTGELNGGSVVANGSGSLVVIGPGLTEIGSPTFQATNFGKVEFQNGDFINNINMPTGGTNGIVSIGSGAILDNTGVTAGSSSTLQAPSGGTLLLNNGGTISGGTVDSASGIFLNASSGILNGTPSGGITLVGTMQEFNSATTYVQGLINDTSGFTFEPSPVNSVGYSLIMSGNTELSGAGTTTTLSGNLINPVVFGGKTGAETLTVDAGHTLLTQADISQSSLSMAVVNSGTIQADGGGNRLYLLLKNGSSSNSSTMKATNGGLFTIDTTAGGTFTNTGNLLADGSGSELVIRGNGITNAGTGSIQANNGATVELQNGNFINNGYDKAGAGSTFSIGNRAILDNTGTTPGSSDILQPSPGGVLQLNGGTITGGTVSNSGGTFISNDVSSNGVTLDGTPAAGITILGTLLHTNGTITSLQGLINVPDGFTFDSAPSAGTGVFYYITLSGDTELSGAGTVTTLANSNGGTVYFGGDFSGQQLTVDSGHTLLSHANIQPASAGPFTLVNNGTIQADGTGNGFFMALGNASNNAGAIAATNGATVTLDTGGNFFTFTNSGTLEASSGGILAFVGADLINTGTIALHNGTLSTDVALAVGDGTLTGSGTIDGDVTLNSDPSTLAFQIRSNTDFDSLVVNGDISLAGNLEIMVAPGAASFIAAGDTFDVLNANSLSGLFLNVTDGQRLDTSDGDGSFLVNYGSGAFADEIVLSDFQAVPEPAAVSLLGMGALVFLRRRRRIVDSVRASPRAPWPRIPTRCTPKLGPQSRPFSH